jgi:hypothetical protein
MTVLLSPVGGVAAQFFDNNGNPLSGGKLFSYSAGTTTPAATFTSSLGTTAHTNPIILDAGGRVPGGEIWLTDGVIYKFVLQTSTNVLIATYDNIVGINSNFVNYTTEQEIQTATAGQTVFNLTTTQYQPGTNSLTVYVDGVNQYGPGAQYAYFETDSDTVTFVSGLHVGASVKFTTATQTTGNATDASVVTYNPPFTGAVATNVEDKLAQTVSVMDFGATGNGVTNDAAAILLAFASGNSVYLPKGTYFVNTTALELPENVIVYGDGPETVILGDGGNPVLTFTGTSGTHKTRSTLRDLTVKRSNGVYAPLNKQLVEFLYADDCNVENVIFDGDNATSAYPGALIGYSVNRMRIVDCDFIGGANLNLTSAGALSTNPFSEECVVKNCYMAPAPSQGFNFYYVNNLIVDGCTAHGRTSTFGCGFVIEYQGANITFTNCISYDNTRSGFYLEPDVAQGLAAVTFNNCIAYNNGETALYAQNSFGLVVNGGAYYGSTTAFTGSNAGIALEDSSQQCTITGAYIHSNQVCGLRIATGVGNTISSNVFYNNNGPAILYTASSLAQNIVGNTFISNSSIISGWVENQTGTFSDYEWASYTPVVYSNDGATPITLSNVSVKYKKIAAQTCLIHGYFEFAGSALNNIIYITAPFTVERGPGGNTGPGASTMRGTAKGSASAVLPVASLFFPASLSISGMTASDTSVTFTATYEIA